MTQQWERLDDVPRRMRLMVPAVVAGALLAAWLLSPGGGDPAAGTLGVERDADAGRRTPGPSSSAVVQPVPTPCSQPDASVDWCHIAPSPLRGRWMAATIWTGKTMMVWGGFDDAREPAPVDDGATYDPDTDTWTSMPPAPIRGRGLAAAAWTGDRMIVWGGLAGGSDLADGAAYDPLTGVWRRLPAAPLTGRRAPAAAWTGTELLVWGGWRLGGAVNDGAAYDPVARHWRLLPPPPIRLRSAPVWAWTGEELILTDAGTAVAYNPARDRWRRLPDPPVDRSFGSGLALWQAAWTGRELLVTLDPQRHPPRFTAYDPAADRWRIADEPPLGRRWRPELVWTGRRLIVWGGSSQDPARPPTDGALYDPGTDEWMPLSPPPLSWRTGASTVWTGDEVIIWGGRELAGVAADGAALRLPRERAPRG